MATYRSAFVSRSITASRFPSRPSGDRRDGMVAVVEADGALNG